MNIELVPCYEDRAFYILLAKDYIEALREYDDRIIWDEATWNKEIWDAFFIVEGGILCGFVCRTEIEYKNKPKLMFIDEFYIAPDERKRKVGIEAVRELTKDWKGEVGLYVLDRNEGAKAFWGAVEKELGWTRTDRPDVRREEGCELRLFRLPS